MADNQTKEGKQDFKPYRLFNPVSPSWSGIGYQDIVKPQGLSEDQMAEVSSTLTSVSYLGVGTASPTTTLEVASATSPQMKISYDLTHYETLGVDVNGRFSLRPGLWKINQDYTYFTNTTAISNYIDETGITIPANSQVDFFRVQPDFTIGANANFRFINYSISSLAGSSPSSNCYAVIGQMLNYGPGTTKALYGRVTAMAGSTGDVIGVVAAATPAAGTNFCAGIQISMDSTAKNGDAGIWLMSQTYPSSSGLNYGYLIDGTINIASAGYQMNAGGAGDLIVLKNSAGSANLFKVSSLGYIEVGTTFGVATQFQVTTSTTIENLNRYSADTNAPYLRFEKMRSSAGAAAASGDSVGIIDFNVRNTTPDWKSLAQITCVAQDVTAASEDGVVLISATVAGASAEYIRIGDITGAGVSGVIINNSSQSMQIQAKGLTAPSLFVISAGTDRISSTVNDIFTTPIYNYIQSGVGDASIRFSIGTTNSWAIGADNSDSDSFKVSWLGSGSAILGTNDYLTITAGGLLLGNISNNLTSPHIDLIQASTGDSATRWLLTGANSFIAGIDNSDLDKWKLSYGSAGNAALGTNDYITVTVGGAVSMGGLSVTSVTDSGLTSGRVTFASTAGLLADDAGFTFDGVTLTLSDSNALTTPLAIINQASTGDSAIRFTLATTASYVVGIDNSDSDKWKVSYAASGTAALGTGDYLTIGTDGEMIAVQWLQVGTATDAATQGDFVTGLTGAARLFYDQSVPALYSYNSLGTIVNQLSSVAATATVWNEQGADIDFRIEGDTLANLFFVDASADKVGINTAAPAVRCEILDTAQQLRLSYDATHVTDFQVLSTGALTITPGTSLVLVDRNADDAYQFIVRNQSNTANAQAYIEARVGGSTAADAFFMVDVSGGNSYSMGLDNSDSDAFKISYGTASDSRPGTNDFFNMKTTGSVAVAKASLATTATDGFLYVPTCAGTPTGVPTTITGYAPIVVDTTNNRWYFYSGGAWRNAGP